MTAWSRRKWLLSGAALSAGLLAGLRSVTRSRAQEPPSGGRSCRWEDLGIRSDDLSYRAWFVVALRAADNNHYIYSGGTNGKNHLLRWDIERERWVIQKRGNEGNPDGSSHNWFPWPGAEFPAAVDNGFAVWDNVNDELWVNCVNPWGSGPPGSPFNQWKPFSPAIYSPRADKWREVTPAEFPTFDFAVLPKVHNAGCASSPEHLILYGGRDEIQATLWIYEGKTRRWARRLRHGDGWGKPGEVGGIENQLQWAPSLGLFVLYAHRRVFTLSVDWKWEERRTAGEPPPMGHSVNLVLLPDQEQAAVVGGLTPDVWLLDLRRWRWSRVVSEKPLPPVPRKDGAAWANRKGLYVAWGQEFDVPAEIIRRAFVCRSLVS